MLKKIIPILNLFALIVFFSCNSTETKQQTAMTTDSIPPIGDGHFRPIYHYAPPKNWVNDPNGLVFHEGKYHLFYQYNPYGSKWGHMTWAHAVTADFFHWVEQPIAIPENERDSVMIFSGSAVVDAKNSSGLGTAENPPLVAVYTAHHYRAKHLQNQHLAYSNDGGTSWVKYDKNPVIDLGKEDFRDPNVFWHEQSKQWVMAVVLPKEYKCLFYGSKDLKAWTLLSEFTNTGDRRSIWECPALVELPLDNGKQSKWALLISAAHPDTTKGYVGMQYFVGDFDGKTFKNVNSPETVLWLDYGKDFYAAIPWNQTPDNRKIIYAWMSNWAYAGDVPTQTWRGQFSLPRTVRLQTYPEGIRIVQQPVEELVRLRKKEIPFENTTLEGINQVFNTLKSNTLEINITFEIPEKETEKEFGLKLRQGAQEETVVGYEVEKQQLFLDRTRSGKVSFSPKFPSRETAPLFLEKNQIKLQIFLDRSSVEVFANEGKVAMTSLVFPSKESNGLSIFSYSGKAKITSIQVWELGK